MPFGFAADAPRVWALPRREPNNAGAPSCCDLSNPSSPSADRPGDAGDGEHIAFLARVSRMKH